MLVSWLPVEERVNQIKLGHMHRIMNNQALEYLTINMIRTTQRHDHYIRSTVSSVIVERKSTIGKSSFDYTAKSLWNGLPTRIVNIQNNKAFKFEVKSLFFDQMSSRDTNPFLFY